MSATSAVSVSLATTAREDPYGLILARWYDSLLVGGCALLALAAAAALAGDALLLGPIISLDMALLGYPHVIAAYTRIGLDRQSWFLCTGLPVIVVSVTAALGYLIGPWLLATLYIYWQTFHYVRQSYGIARIYQRKAGESRPAGGPATTAMIYLLPLWGILYRSWQQPKALIGMELRMLPVPYAAVAAAGAIALVAIAVWLMQTAQSLREGKLAIAHALYLLTHIAVFGVGYLLLADNTQGWAVINIWHNAQYLLIVWLHHNGRAQRAGDGQSRFTALLGRNRLFFFFAVCFALSYAMYAAIYWATDGSSLLVAMIALQSVNFHHYLVDGMIWRLRKPKLRADLDLAA